MTVLNLPTEVILAENVDFETFLRDYMGQHVEWVNGMVIEMSPISDKHDDITRFLNTFFGLYLKKTKDGKVRADPFTMRLAPEGPARQPDLLIVKTENLARLTPTYLEGPADLVIEVVSLESSQRDRGTKFHEYEAAGVPEYWIIDPVHKETAFYVLDADQIYERRELDDEGYYTSRVLPRVRFQPSILLSDQADDPWKAVELVEQIMAE